MFVDIPTPLKRFAEAVGEQVYMVGGAVRNALLELPRADLDVAGAMLPDAVETKCRAAGFAVSKINKSLGTVGVVIDGETVEYTAFRAERYASGGGHMPETVQLGGSMADDAIRRDFTVNALYADCFTGEVFDPTGGLADLQNRVLRQAGPDTLKSDALRILRMVRFACELGFSIDETTFAVAKAHAKGLFDIAPERRREELDRILVCDGRYPSVSDSVLRGLHLLTELGAWDALIPEVTEGRDMAQRSDYHKYTVMEHLFRTCAAMPLSGEADVTMRLAALLHDIGKPKCKRENGNMYAHDRIGADIARERLNALRYPNAVIADVTALVRHHMYDIQNAAKEKTLKKRFAAWGRPLTERLIVMREADIHGCGTNDAFINTRWRELYQKMLSDGVPFSEAELKITGADIMRILNLQSGQQVGKIKKQLLDHCILHPKDNNRGALIAMVKRKAR